MECRAELALIGAKAIHFRRIEMVDAQIDRRVQQVDRVRFGHRRAVEGGHAHAAKADGVAGRTIFSDFAADHG